MNTLDFLVIGAQKAATTSLHSLLCQHPELSMPGNKEAPFFSREPYQEHQWDDFMLQHFRDGGNTLRGKISPQYMGHPDAPRRIARIAPEVRLIAILRDPASRALSHYKMDLRRETEARGFSTAINSCLRPTRLEQARLLAPPEHTEEYETESDFYVCWGEYGRILRGYLRYFKRSQILILTVDQLKQDPAGTLHAVLQHIGASTEFRPKNLGINSHKGGTKPRVSREQKQKILRFPLARRAWQAVPDEQRERLRYWLDQKNVRSASEETIKMDPDTESRLRLHYAKDVLQLQEIFNIEVPWAAKYDAVVS